MVSIDHDLHIHTGLSPCCTDVNQTLHNIVAVCRDLGLHKIGLSDHAWLRRSTTPADWGPNPRGFKKLAVELAALSPEITVLRGCEADTLAPGRFTIDRKFADTLDYVILATNHFHFRELVEQPVAATPQGIAAHMVRMFLAGVRSGLANIIPHVFMPMGFWEFYEPAVASISDCVFIETFAEAAAHDVAIEITAVYLPPPPGVRRHTWNIDTPLRVLTLAKQAGCRFTFGTDSHALTSLPQILYLAPLLERLELTADDIHPLARTCCS